MTEVLINELSLSGQFNSAEEFINSGSLTKFNKLLNEMKRSDVLLYKNTGFYGSLVTKEISVFDLFAGAVSRQYDEFRKMKSGLSCLFDEPYWEINQKHSHDIMYMHNNVCVTGKSLAEACERDKIVISFLHQDYSHNNISVLKGENKILLDNLINENDFVNLAWEKEIINCEEYCKMKFRNTKLDFSRLVPEESFVLLNKKDEKLFIDGFRKFSELSWQQIFTDDGLGYKEYKDNKKYFRKYGKKIKKFRTSQKYRCFGYEEQDKFYVLVFDLAHKYSDYG